MSVRVTKTEVQAGVTPDEHALRVAQLASEVTKTVNVENYLSVAQEVVEGTRTSVIRELVVGQYCIELLRPTKGAGKLAANLVSEATLTVGDLIPGLLCEPCVPIYYKATIPFQRFTFPAPPCEPVCPPEIGDDFRSKQ